MNRSKKEHKPINFIWAGVGFGVVYWIMESIRNVLIFERENILKEIFFPDPMGLWMRVLVVCIIILFSVRVQVYRESMKNRTQRRPSAHHMIRIVRVGISFAALYWVLEAFRDFFVFHRGTILKCLFVPEPMDVWIRLLAIFILFLFGIYVQTIINDKIRLETEMKERHDELVKLVNDRTEELANMNSILKNEIYQKEDIHNRLIRANKSLRIISECNKAIIRTENESDLLNDFCSILVEEGGYDLSWIGYVGRDEMNSIRLMAKAGSDRHYLEKVQFNWEDRDRDTSPVSCSVRQSKPVIHYYGSKDADVPAWDEEAVRSGFSSSISLPLRCDDYTFGVLNIYSRNAYVFDSQESRLLVEMTNDIVYGINSMRTRAEHNRLTRLLTESEKKYGTILENINVGIFRFMPEGGQSFLEANPALAEMFGYRDQDEMKDIGFSDLFLGDADRKRIDEKLCRDGSLENEEILMRRNNGDAIWCALTAVAILDRSGRMRYCDGVIEDISERKRMQKDVQIKDIAITSSINAIAFSDLEGMITYVNPSFLEMWSFEKVQDVLGKPVTEFWSDQKEVEKLIGNLVRDGNWIGEMQAKRSNGELFDVQICSNMVYDRDGKSICMMASFVDVSEKKRAISEKQEVEKLLFQAQKMEEVGILAGGIAHDFNNLLTAILGIVDLSMMDLDEKDVPYKDLFEIRELALNGSGIVRQLLLFSRRQHMESKNISINESISGLQKMLGHIIGEDIHIRTELSEGVRTIYADRFMLDQVIMNLAVNARDAMPDGGELVIGTENVCFEESPDRPEDEGRVGEFVKLRVSDTGVGMDRETVNHIFEPFFTTKSAGSGTGLGLSVVYGIVNQHQGWISVDSVPKKGTTFSIFFPAALPDQESGEREAECVETIDGRGRRILLIEDDDKILDCTNSYLENHGFEVISTSSAAEAERMFEKKKGDFDFIISDVVLPDRNGLELVSDFVDSNPNLRIIMNSGYTDVKSRMDTIKEKGFMFLEKPFMFSELFKLMNQQEG